MCHFYSQDLEMAKEVPARTEIPDVNNLLNTLMHIT